MTMKIHGNSQQKRKLQNFEEIQFATLIGKRKCILNPPYLSCAKTMCMPSDHMIKTQPQISENQ